MKIWIIGIVILVIFLCFSSRSNYRPPPHTDRESNFLGPLNLDLMQTHNADLKEVKGSYGPGTTSDYDKYSLYSTKIWPAVYQPVTNTCFDEFMRECTYNCDSKECIEDCQVRGTSICSKKQNIPPLIRN